MDYITRISYNSKGWCKPTGEAAKLEKVPTFNTEHGFGCEDWLFRKEWEIDGWRYAFVQGVGRSIKLLRKRDEPFGLRLFCIEPDRKRRYVADIKPVHYLSEAEANDALEVFREKDWLKAMKNEVEVVDGVLDILNNPSDATQILNVRFRPGAVKLLPKGQYAGTNDPVRGYCRYNLIQLPPRNHGRL